MLLNLDTCSVLIQCHLSVKEIVKDGERMTVNYCKKYRPSR